MNLQTRVKRLEQSSGTVSDDCALWDMTLLTDAELTALLGCYTGAGELMPECLTPEIEAALRRVER